MIKVCAFVDPLGSTMSTAEDEYKEIREQLEKILEQEILFKSGVPPWTISTELCDCYILDWLG